MKEQQGLCYIFVAEQLNCGLKWNIPLKDHQFFHCPLWLKGVVKRVHLQTHPSVMSQRTDTPDDAPAKTTWPDCPSLLQAHFVLRPDVMSAAGSKHPRSQRGTAWKQSKVPCGALGTWRSPVMMGPTSRTVFSACLQKPPQGNLWVLRTFSR